MEKIAEKVPNLKMYTDFSDLIADPDIDIISICLPSSLHAEYAVRAMEAGKHVLVEKPIDITVDAAQKIEEARLRTGKKAGVIHQNLTNFPIHIQSTSLFRSM